MKDKYSFIQKTFMWLSVLFSFLIFGPFAFLILIFAPFEIHSKVKVETELK